MNGVFETMENPLAALNAQLEKEHSMKYDVVVPGQKMYYDNGQLWVPGGFTPTGLCHTQISEKLGIPKGYYDKMKETYPALLENNINMWLKKSEKVNYLLRTFAAPSLDGFEGVSIARAFLSDKFNVIDNFDVLVAALEAIKAMNVNVRIIKAEVTDRRMYLHVVCPQIELDAKHLLQNYMVENNSVGNGIVSGMVISNSEVGLGTFEVRPRAFIGKCRNGLVVADDKFSRVHLGSRMNEGVIEWSESTKRANFQLIMSQVKDAVRTFLSEKYLGRIIDNMTEAFNTKLDNPIDTVQHVCKTLAVTEEHRRNILNYFMKDGDLNGSGVIQAVTREAQNMNADAQYDVEMGVFSMARNMKKYDKIFKN